jgi:proline iminopeptidase
VNTQPESRPLPSPEETPESLPRSPLSPGTHTITVQHGTAVVEQRYHVAGAGPVCVAHSGGPGIGWEYLRMPLLERSLTMVYVEPVGTGASGRLPDPREYHLATYVRHLHAVVEHLALPEVALLGHSHGGFVAQRYVLDHPECVGSLVLYDTSPVSDETFWSVALANMAQFAQRHVTAHPEVAGYVEALSTPLAELSDDAATEVLRTIIPAYYFDYWGREEEFGPGRASMVMHAEPSSGEGPTFDVRAELASVTTPTLIVVGAQDFICGPQWAREIHQEIPGAQLAVLQDTGHVAHVEKPEQFAALVVEFVTARRQAAG